MKLLEKVKIHANPAEVWSRLVDPSYWPQWNHKVVGVQRDPRGPLIQGEHFNAIMQLNGRPLPCQVEVRHCQEQRHLLLRERFEHGRRWRHVDVAFDLVMDNDEVRVTQSTDISSAGIPWPLRLFLWWVHRTGRPVGLSALDELKTQLDSSAA